MLEFYYDITDKVSEKTLNWFRWTPTASAWVFMEIFQRQRKNARKGTIEKKASIFATTKEAEDYSS